MRGQYPGHVITFDQSGITPPSADPELPQIDTLRAPARPSPGSHGGIIYCCPYVGILDRKKVYFQEEKTKIGNISLPFFGRRKNIFVVYISSYAEHRE